MRTEQTLRQEVMGRRILVRRERAGLSQHALGKRVGVSQATVANWESGASVPRWPTIWILGEALGVSPRWLVEPLVVDVAEVQTGEDDLGPGASSSMTLQGKTTGSHAGDPTLGAMASEVESRVEVDTDGPRATRRGEHGPTPAEPTVGGWSPGGSNEERIDRLEQRTDRIMDLLLRLRREVRGQRR